MSTNTSAGTPHLSIGEVLSHLREEFPDITISKIRFLESQGLIDPERTPSGYRKFYEADVARLRWILHQQKEHFLPLKVIKERLEQLGVDADSAPSDAPPSDAPPPPRDDGHRTTGAADPPPLLVAGDDDGDDWKRAFSSGAVSLTRAELAQAAGLDETQLAELESFGLVAPVTQSGDRVLFDEEALAVARAAAGFYERGLETRHLRMYKHFVQREASLFEQVLLPLLRQRNPEARARAQAEVTELARLGRSLRAGLLVAAVREALAD